MNKEVRRSVAPPLYLLLLPFPLVITFEKE